MRPHKPKIVRLDSRKIMEYFAKLDAAKAPPSGTSSRAGSGASDAKLAAFGLLAGLIVSGLILLFGFGTPAAFGAECWTTAQTGSVYDSLESCMQNGMLAVALECENISEPKARSQCYSQAFYINCERCSNEPKHRD